MVAQYTQSIVRHMQGDVFEVTTFPGPVAEVFRVEPVMGRCSCGAVRCPHLWDASAFLEDHSCPLCRGYSPFRVLCPGCYSVVEAATAPQVVAA